MKLYFLGGKKKGGGGALWESLGIKITSRMRILEKISYH